MDQFEKFMASPKGLMHKSKCFEDLIYHKTILPETTAAIRKDMDEYLIECMNSRFANRPKGS
jgi:hypothetical protein